MLYSRQEERKVDRQTRTDRQIGTNYGGKEIAVEILENKHVMLFLFG